MTETLRAGAGRCPRCSTTPVASGGPEERLCLLAWVDDPDLSRGGVGDY